MSVGDLFNKVLRGSLDTDFQDVEDIFKIFNE